MRRIFLFASVISFIAPIFVFADIRVTEVAWMGTAVSANDEWIEIHNSGSSSVSLSGWSLDATDGTPTINLSGTIAPGAYELLERTDDSSEPSVQALLIFTGALGNEGEDLALTNSDGNIIQNLDFSSGWSAGDVTSKQTMQWSGSSWVTATATPGSSYGGGSGDDDDEEEEENGDDDEEEEEDVETTTTSSETTLGKSYTSMLADIVVEDTSVPVGAPVHFSLNTRDLNGAKIFRGDFFWNMGDGTERFYNENKEFSHTYDHAGTYVVSLRFYKTYFEGNDPDVVDKVTITINDTSVVITKIHPDGGVEIKNTSSQEVDLSGWVLKDSNNKRFLIPDHTFIMASKIMVLSSKRTKLNPTEVYLYNPSGGLVSHVNMFSIQTKSVAYSPSSTPIVQKTTTTSTMNTVFDSTNLNNHLSANTLNAINTQKQPPVWVIAFVVLLISSSVCIYFIYTKSTKEEVKTKDEFELLD